MVQILNQSSPFFIIGLPRSGTKLLRDLLRQHPLVVIPSSESHFIPYFIKKYGNKPNLNNKKGKEIFINEFKKTTFFYNIQNEGYMFNESDFLEKVDFSKWASIFQYLLKNFGGNCKNDLKVWGDKTPEYMSHIKLIKSIYHNAKFIHIIRDPRDQAISSRKVWGKNLYRSAQRWIDSINLARKDAESFKNDYVEIRYEDLLLKPEESLRLICMTLNIDYKKDMLSLNGKTEFYGDTIGAKTIKANNVNKYEGYLKEKEIKRVNQITIPLLKDLSYDFEKKTINKPLSNIEKGIFKMLDATMLLKFHIREKGFMNGVNYYLNIYREINNI